MSDEMSPEMAVAYADARQRLAEIRAEREARPVEEPRDADPLASLLASIELRHTPEEAAAIEADRIAGEERDAKRRARQTRDAIAEALAAVPVKPSIVDAIADERLDPTAALTAVQRWASAKDAKPVLMLLGGVGSGKTVGAAWAIGDLARRHRQTTYTKMRDVANLYRAGFGDDLKSFERMLRVTLLVVDELGTERDLDLGRAALHEIVDERGSRNRRTILLANRTKDEIRERYDARTLDRLRECAAVVTLADASKRKGAW